MHKLLKKHGRVPRVLLTDKLRSCTAANRDPGLDLDHRQHKRRFGSARHLQRFASTHDQVANLFIHSRDNRDATAKRAARTLAFTVWGRASGARTFGVTAT
jgi:putative transposase